MRATTITLGTAVGLLLMLTPSAGAKSMYGLQLGDSITTQGEISPTVFAGEPCVKVVADARGSGWRHGETGVVEIQAGQTYWQMVLFRNTARTEVLEADPTLILRDLDTGETVRESVVDVQSNAPGAYATLEFNFPHAGEWSAAIDDGHGHTYDYADGTVVSTASGPEGVALTDAELNDLAPTDPGLETCSETAAAGVGGGNDGDGSIVAALAIGLGAAAALAALVLGFRRGRLA